MKKWQRMHFAKCDLVGKENLIILFFSDLNHFYVFIYWLFAIMNHIYI